jgi:hypothetical protein
MNQVVNTTGIASSGNTLSGSKRLPAPSLMLFLMLAIIFVMFNTVFQTFGLPSVPLAGGARMFVQDLLLWLLVLFGLFAKLNNRRTAVSSGLSGYILFFVFIVVAEALYAVVALDRPIFRVYNDSKDFYYYLLFFPVIWCFGTDKGVEWIIRLWAVLALLGALLYLYQFSFGELSIFQKYDWLYSSSVEVATGGASSVTVDYMRLLSQGTVLFRIMLFVAFCMWLFPTGRRRLWWGWLALLLAMQVLLQFTRGMYVTTLLALLLMPLLIRESAARAKIRNILVLSVFAVTVAIIYKMIFSSSGAGSYGLFEFIGERFFRGVTEMGQDTSLQGRVQGAEYIFSKMEDNWLFGIGFGAGVVYGDSTLVSLLAKTGLIGTAAFFVMIIQACLRGLRRYRYLDSPVHKALMLALLFSTARHLINGITQSDWALDTRIAALIVSVAMMEVIGARALAARKAETPAA